MAVMGQGRTPLIAELLGGGGLLAIILATVTFASQWGGTLRAVEDHVDPTKHELIVLAGNVETGKKIAVIESDIGHVKDAVEDNRETAKEIQGEVADIKSDIRLILELNRRALAVPQPRAIRPAAPADSP